MHTTQTRNWTADFEKWAQPPSKSEQERCANAESMVRNAIAKSPKLQSRGVEVFVHGSYANRTNVRQDSDVDVGVAFKDFFKYDLPSGYTREQFGIIPYSGYGYSEFKNDLEQALRDYFEGGVVTRGNKAFDIKASSYHVEADVTPFVDYRQYFPSGQPRSGYVLLPDNGGRIENYPHQHHSNGIAKNDQTSRRFKRVARVLKSICYEMREQGYAEAQSVPGFLLECLAGLTPNPQFSSPDLIETTRNVVIWLYGEMAPEKDCSNWTELNGIKYLFHPNQPWRREDARAFLESLWNYVGFSNL